jgi:hypothetical protein
MSQSLKISKYLGKDDNGNDLFVLTVPPTQEWNGNPTEERIKVTHDYVEVSGGCSFELLPGVNKPESQKLGASNWLSSRASIQISIREVFGFILPYLNKHKYLQPNHFEDRVWDEDDEHWSFHKCYSGPRWKKGDKYPPYAYEGGIVHYIDEENGNQMVAFRRVGESTFNHVTASTFNTIKDTLRLSYRHPDEF